MKNYDIKSHVNYVHLVGEITSIEHRRRVDQSNYCIIFLEIVTEFRGNVHSPVKAKVIFWSEIADKIEEHNLVIGDTINVEGRFTIRAKDNMVEYTVTGNKIKVVRDIPNAEPFLQEL